jgi:hypothetical protein
MGSERLMTPPSRSPYGNAEKTGDGIFGRRLPSAEFDDRAYPFARS